MNSYSAGECSIERYRELNSALVSNPSDLTILGEMISALQDYVFCENAWRYSCSKNDLYFNKNGAAIKTLMILPGISKSRYLQSLFYAISAQNFFVLGEYSQALEWYNQLLQCPNIQPKRMQTTSYAGENENAAKIIHNMMVINSIRNDSASFDNLLNQYSYVFDLEKGRTERLIKNNPRLKKGFEKEYQNLVSYGAKTTFYLETSGFHYSENSSRLSTIYEDCCRNHASAEPSFSDDTAVVMNNNLVFLCDDGFIHIEDEDGVMVEVGMINRINQPSVSLAVSNVEKKEQVTENKIEVSTCSEGSKVLYADLLAELNSLVGLNSIKEDVTNLIGLVRMQKIRETKGLKSVPVSLHLVFTGNPGTGKTTIARILSGLYKEIGVLKKGQLVEVDRSGLVAGYVGQTAIKTQEKINESIGGILFIDEAYTLAKEGNDYGQEAIDTLLKAMEDHRDEFVVIVAGYEEQMIKFINSNPGLKSRFNKYFSFPDYSAEELIEIFDRMCQRYDYKLDEEAEQIAHLNIVEMEKNKGQFFANARDVRNYFESIVTRQASRVASLENLSDADVITICPEDVVL